MSQELEPWNDPKIEALVVAAVLGEASDFEQEEVENLCAEHPELALFRQRIEGTHRALSEVHAEEEEEWTLSSEKRKGLLLQLEGTEETVSADPAETLPPKVSAFPLKRIMKTPQMRAALMMAACLALGLFLLARNTSAVKSYASKETLAWNEKKGKSGWSNYPPTDGISVEEELVEASQSEMLPVPSSTLADRENIVRGIPAVQAPELLAEVKKSKMRPAGSVNGAPMPSSPAPLSNKPSSRFRSQASASGEQDPFADSSGRFEGSDDFGRASRSEATPAQAVDAFADISSLQADPFTLGAQKTDGDETLMLAERARQVGKYEIAKEHLEDALTSQSGLAYELSETERVSVTFPFSTTKSKSEAIITFKNQRMTKELPIEEDMTLASALKGAGGPGTFDSKNHIILERNGKVYTYDMRNADHRNIKIYPKDVIKLPRVQKDSALISALSKIEGEKAQQEKAKKKAQEAEEKKKAEKKKRAAEALNGAETSAVEEAFSTFSLNVSDVSFKLAAAALQKGTLPEEVRVEDFVNAFDYGDPSPSAEEKVSCVLEQAIHPFLQQRNLLRVSMKTAAAGRNSSVPLNLTILLDRSGSMQRGDRKASVIGALSLLLKQLQPQDEVTLITFARGNRLLLDRARGMDERKAQGLLSQIDFLPTEGGTNLEEVLKLGLQKAQASHTSRPTASSRIILMTDGAANLGNASPETLSKTVQQMRDKKISFDACGVGAEGLNDSILENLTREGDGRYYFLNRAEDADAGFARQIAGALRPAAKNVKVQVEWNADRVDHYKLYGFQKHRLKKEDFRDDTVDAAEMAAAEEGSALYHVQVKPEGSGDLGAVSVRFLDVSTGQMVEKRWSIPYDPTVQKLTSVTESMRTAAVAGLLGEALSGSPTGTQVDLQKLQELTPLLKGKTENVKTLKGMINQFQRMK